MFKTKNIFPDEDESPATPPLLDAPPTLNEDKSPPPLPSPPGTSISLPPNTSKDGGEELTKGGTTNAKSKCKQHKHPAKANSAEVDRELTVWRTKKRYCKLAMSNVELFIHVDQCLESTMKCGNITCQCLNLLSDPILGAPVVKYLVGFKRKSKYNEDIIMLEWCKY